MVRSAIRLDDPLAFVLATNDHRGEPGGEADYADLIRKHYLNRAGPR
jgi:hypothetical protein